MDTSDVKSEKVLSNLPVEIYALNGTKVLKMMTNNSIQIGNLIQGTYLLKMQIDGKIFQQKFVK